MKIQTAISRNFLIGLTMVLTIAIAAAWGQGSPTLSAQSMPDGQHSPEALGSISGTVVGTDDVPLSGVTVTLLAARSISGPFGIPVTTYEEVLTIETDDSGNYSFTAIPTNIYRVQATAPGTLYTDTSWKNGSADISPENARDIPVSGNDVSGIDMVMPLGGRIGGQLSFIGDSDLNAYRLSLYRVDEDGFYSFVKGQEFGSDSKRYETESVEPGSYVLCMTARATIAGPFPYVENDATECFDDHILGVESSTPVVVEVGKTTLGVDFHLGESSQYAQISGTITGEDGSPAANVEVVAYPAPAGEGIHQRTMTDDLGRYVLDRLGPFAYYLDFRTRLTPYMPEYYADAEIITLEAGTVLVNVDAELALGGRITGLVDIQGERAPSNGFVWANKVDGSVPFSQETAIDPTTGEYTLEGLLTGNYEVYAMANETPGNSYTLYYEGSPAEELLPISVTVGSTISDINISLAEGLFEGQIQGNVFDDNGPLSDIRVELYNGLGFGQAAIFYTTTDENGDYAIEGLRTDTYYLRFVDPAGVYLSQYYDGVEFRDDATAITVLDGDIVVDIDANMSQPGALSGHVLLADGTPAANYSVRIAQSRRGPDAATVAEQTTDGNGSYMIENISPGDYQLLVLEPYVDDGLYRSVESRLVYEDAVGIESGAVLAEGQSKIIQLAGSDADAPQLAPVLFVPVSIH